MRLLVVSQYFWPENFLINQVVRSLKSRGLCVEVLTGQPNYPEGRVFDGYRAWGCENRHYEGIPVRRIPLMPRGHGAIRLFFNYLSFVLSGILIAPQRLRGREYDLIFVFAPSPLMQAIPALWIGWLKKIPVAIWVQDLWPESLAATGHITNPLLLALVERLVRWIYRHADLLLVQSEAFVDPISKLAGNTPIAYLPNSADEGVIPGSETETPSIPALEEGFPILFAGNIGIAQSVETIILAAELLRDIPDIRFVVVGDGSRRDWMASEIERRHLHNVHLPGRYPPENMPRLMGKAAALLVTLADRRIFELTIPSKLQAYMKIGRPIIACLNGEGARLITESGAGLTAPAEDAAALADAIRRLYELPARDLNNMGERGRQYYARHFSHNLLMEKLTGYFEYLTNQAKRRK